MKIKDILHLGNKILIENKIEDSNLKAKLLLSELLNKPKEYLMIYDETEIENEISKLFFEGIEKLKNNVPIQYIINKQEFFGLEFYVDENVLIPQPDTEILVEECIKICENKEKNISILDLCTGSGAIGISVAKNISNSKVYMSDISKKALDIAKRNSLKNNVKVTCIESNLFENIDYKFDLIISNPPYIETEIIEQLSEEVKKEPILALDGGEDGLKFYKEIIKNAKKYLKENGYLLLEIGYNQRKAVHEILEKNSFKNIYSKKDLGNNDRIIVAQK